MNKLHLQVLIAEDVEDDALLTVDVLGRRFDVTFERVQTADTMREALQRKTWDLVISDWQMPTFTALQALALTRENDPEMPFIVVSGTIEEEIAVRAMELGAHDYIIKDNLTRLNAAVERELREAAIRRELARTAKELRLRAEELYRSNKELERFAYVAAHDLQEPLRMVASYSELLVRTLSPDGAKMPEAETIVSFIVGAVDRMEQLIQGLLTYSRVVHDTEQEVRQVDLNEVVRAALKHLEPAIMSSGAKIMYDNLPNVAGDSVQLVQIFQNLLSNAIKYRRNGVHPVVEISGDFSGEDCCISVQDNGIGIASEHRERVFQIFKRLHRNEYPGLGIGLALTRRLVEMHGGSIWVEEAPEAGSVFRFTLPCSKKTKLTHAQP